MPIDPRFIITSDLQEFFVDKDSGVPLAGGVVTFYSDVDRTTKKPVYQISSPAPGNFIYNPLQNPLILNSVGGWQDALGNSIVPYYFPYQGVPADNSSVVELYYITIESSGGIQQAVRVAWPNFSSEDISSQQNEENFIPNGQFLSHNNDPQVESSLSGYTAGTVDMYPIAQGGWNLVRTHGGASTFLTKNAFIRIPPGGWGLNDYPRFMFQFQCTSFDASDQVRDLAIIWPDVYKFSGGATPGAQQYTLYFAAKSLDGATRNFDLKLIYSYGTGGSSADEFTLQANIGIGNSVSYHRVLINGFPVPAGTLSTTANDDYVAIALRGPSDAWNIEVTDFALMLGDVTLSFFPEQTNAEMLAEGVAGWMPIPAADGSDLYLPLVLTQEGMTFDHSQVGMIVAKITGPAVNELYCDGSMYITSQFSSLGIPYSRLQGVLYDTSIHLPLFGTGANFAQTYISSGDATTLILANNQPGAQSAAADGAVATTFTFNAVKNTGSSAFNYRFGSNSSGVFSFLSDFTNGTNGGASFADNSTSMTFSDLSSPANLGTFYYGYGNAVSAATVANPGMTGKYFTFSDHGTNYNVWYHITNETSPGGSAIQVNLVSTMTALDVANITACRLNGFQTTTITCVAASSIPANAYFIFFANALKYVVWYNKGGGVQPVVASTQDYIQVTLTGSETAAQVASLTQTAINSYSFAVPDLRGIFLRGIDPTGIWDLDKGIRTGLTANTLTNVLPGTFEYDQFADHTHSISGTANVVGAAGGTFGHIAPGDNSGTAGTSTLNLTLGNAGGTESRPVNMSVFWFIKY